MELSELRHFAALSTIPPLNYSVKSFITNTVYLWLKKNCKVLNAAIHCADVTQ